MKTIAIIGATGAVGRELLALLEERNFPIRSLRCFASPRSIGKQMTFKGEQIPLEPLTPITADFLFFCAGSSISHKWIPQCSGRIIDLSSAFRLDPTVPLIIPEINLHTLHPHHTLVSSPNCAATILLLPLFPLHRLYRTKRIITSTYQAASGGGATLLNQLLTQTRAHLAGTPTGNYAFNLYPHNSSLHPSGYVEEECKMLHETRKILEDPSLQLSATCVRVPVLRAHSLSANVEFHTSPSLPQILSAWNHTPGLQLFEHRPSNRFATPADATGKDPILCGRLRLDPTQPNTIEFWAVGDQLRKGAALNAVQIAEQWR